MSRRLTALILALCMVFSMACTNAWAAEETESGAEASAQSSAEEQEADTSGEEQTAEEDEHNQEDEPEDGSSEELDQSEDSSLEEPDPAAEEKDQPEPVEEAQPGEPETDTEAEASAPMAAGSTNEAEATEETEEAEASAAVEPAASFLATGSCGQSLTWTLTKPDSYNMVLSITGTGDMEEYSVECDHEPGGSNGKDGFLTSCEIISDARPWASYKYSITQVTVGSGVTGISSYAFFDCEYLTSVSLPNTLKTIQDNAFGQCYYLTSIRIPDSVSNFGVNLFLFCTRLSDATLPARMKTIPRGMFEACHSLSGISIPNTVTTIEDVAFHGSVLKSITIPDSVTTLGSWAFAQCHDLTAVTIPGSVKTMGDAVFLGCEELITATIQPGASCVSAHAFTQCDELTRVDIGEGVTTIEVGAFDSCDKLAAVSLPNSLTTIEWLAFRSCISLTSVTFPDGLTTIGDSAFYECTGLTSLKFPNSVKTIGEQAFFGCSNLIYAIIPKSVTTIRRWAFGLPGDITTKLTIYGWSDSAAQSHARSFDIAFVTALENPEITVPDQVYSGKELKPTVTVKQKGKELQKGVDYTVSYRNNYSPGTAEVTVTGMGKYYGEETVSYTAHFTIRKINQNLTVQEIGTLKEGESRALVVSGNKTALSYLSDNTSVAAVDGDGVVKGIAPGRATITVRASGDDSHNAASKSVTVVVTGSATTIYLGANKITVSNVKRTQSKNNQSFSLKAKAKGGAKLSYKSNNKSVKVDKSGKVTIVKNFCGIAKITVTSSAVKQYRKTSKTITVTVIPGKIQFTLISPKKKQMKITLKKQFKADGYELVYLDEDCNTDRELRLKGSAKGYTAKSLESKTIYIVTMRPYKKVGGKTLYGDWTEKTIRVK